MTGKFKSRIFSVLVVLLCSLHSVSFGGSNLGLYLSSNAGEAWSKLIDSPTDSIGYQAASKAYEATFGKKPIPQRSGGSIPIVSLFEQELKSKTILMGFGLDSDAIHSPNEHFGVFNYLKGIETIPLFYKYFTELKTN